MITKLAFRNIFRQKRRTFFTIAAMVVGFVLSAVSIGWADGSYNLVIEVFTRAYLGHIQVHAEDYLDRPSLYKNIEDYRAVGEAISSVEGVELWTPRVLAFGLGSVGEKSTAIQVIGIDPQLENRATMFERKVKNGRCIAENAAHEIVVGKGLAKTLGAGIDDELVVVSQAADGSFANDLYRIVGIAETGDEMSDRSGVYMHLADAMELFVLEGRVHEIVIMVENIKRVDKVVERIDLQLADLSLEVIPWKKVNEVFYNSMKADKQGGDILYFTIMIIVAIGVLNTVLMAVLERTREFGVLKALGTSPSAIFSMIVIEVAFMAIIGIAIGQIIALGVNFYLSVNGIALSSTFDIGGVAMDTMRSEINLKSIVVPTLLVFFSSLLVSIFPALRAARTDPARTMRFH